MMISSDLRSRHNTQAILEHVRRLGTRRGGKLPTERQLAIDLGLSRSAIRNALALLEASGVISREVGRGTFLTVTENDPSTRHHRDDALALGMGDISPSNVIWSRILIEPQAMTMVAASATADDFEEMDRCLWGGKGAKTYEEFESWDLALHRCLIDASHNPLISRMYSLIEVARHSEHWGDLKRRSDSSTRRADYQREHQAIVSTIKVRDARGARDAMLAHLRSVEENLHNFIYE